MTKDQVIYLRNTLKNGKNWAVRATTDNMAVNFDESLDMQFIHWDDDNEVIICFRLESPQRLRYPNNKDKIVWVYGASYADIQSIESVDLNVNYVEQIALNFGADSEHAANVQKMFKYILSTDITNLTYDNIRGIMGKEEGSGVPNRDEYYAGKFVESFQETRMTAFNNQYVDSLKDKDKDDGDDDSGDNTGDTGDTNP